MSATPHAIGTFILGTILLLIARMFSVIEGFTGQIGGLTASRIAWAGWIVMFISCLFILAIAFEIVSQGVVGRRGQR